MSEIPKAYEPRAVEERWYDYWLKHGCFTADPTRVSDQRPAYSIVIPPPNVTGMLHMGHVLNNTIQDLLSRKARMDGKEVLWLPGTDHAGIATQAVVEKALRKQGLMKHRDDLGREKFLEHVWAWKEKHGGIIIQQLKKLGCSCDWTRERFTMDPDYSRCVQRVFVELYKQGLIYRGKRMVNWDPAARTALSDEEVDMIEEKSHLWHLKYPLLDEAGSPMPDQCVVVATTRPETMLGDEAVAVNPNDPRYTKLIGRKVLLPLQNKHIPIIADELVDPKFGTGCVKVTPAHDPADYEMGVRHKLPFTVVIGPDGNMTAAAGEDFDGMDRMEARQAVVEELTEQGLLLKTEDYVHNVGYSQRSHVPIEPYLSEQWFLRYPAIEPSKACVAQPGAASQPEGVTDISPGQRSGLGGADGVHPEGVPDGSAAPAGADMALGTEPRALPGANLPQPSGLAKSPSAPELRFHPDRWAKTYSHWMTNLRDWCISRQLWWGHRVPVWTKRVPKNAAARKMKQASDLMFEALSEHLQGTGSKIVERFPLFEESWSGQAGHSSYCRSRDDDEDSTVLEAATISEQEAAALEAEGFTQDPDVLDTWFSSWLWPFATMGWTGDRIQDSNNPTLQSFYPTTDLVTAPEIIFFWVARMIMAGYEFMGDLPFRNVYFTGIIRDKLGRKMSKSLGNSPDPLDLIAKYGADAVRFGTMRSAPLGQDVMFDEKDVELGRNFCNKLWNACRFRQMQGGEVEREVDPALLTSDDKWILLKLDQAIREIDEAFAGYRFNEVTQTLYRLFWSEYCDWYVEASKAVLGSAERGTRNAESEPANAERGMRNAESGLGRAEGGGRKAESESGSADRETAGGQSAIRNPQSAMDDARRANTLAVMDFVLSHMLRLFHPFLPFITEELWQGMGFNRDLPAGQGGDTIMFARWPKPLDDDFKAHYGLDESDERLVNAKYDLVGRGRNLRREFNLPLSKKVKFVFKPAGEISAHDTAVIRLLLNAEALDVNPAYAPPKGTPSALTDLGELFMPLEGLIDVAAEKARLQKEIAKAEAEIGKVQQKLNNPAFVQKVPPQVLEEHRKRLADWQSKHQQLHASFHALGEA